MQNSDDRYALPRWWWAITWLMVHLNGIAIVLEWFGYPTIPSSPRYGAIAMMVFVAAGVQLWKTRHE